MCMTWQGATPRREHETLAQCLVLKLMRGLTPLSRLCVAPRAGIMPEGGEVGEASYPDHYRGVMFGVAWAPPGFASSDKPQGSPRSFS